jgi:carboxypeptidase D
MLPKLLLAAFSAGVLCVAPCIDARRMTKHSMKAKQLEAAKRWKPEGAFKDASGGVKNITFSNPKAAGKHRTYYYCCGR